MRRLLFLLLCLPIIAWAEPRCVPGIYGETLDLAAPKRYDAGWRIVWLCGKDGYAYVEYMACVHGTCSEQTLIDSIRAAVLSTDPATSIKAAWSKNVVLNCATATGSAKVICDQAISDGKVLLAAFMARQEAPVPVVEVWKVAPNGTYTTRPTYAWVNGVRSTTAAAERVAVGATCDAKVGVVTTSTTGSYLGVLGRADRVSLCRK